MSYSQRVLNRTFSIIVVLLFLFLTLNADAQVPDNINGKTLLVTVTSATGGLNPSGKLALVFSDTGDTFVRQRLSSNVSDGSGTFTYVKSSATNATLNLVEGSSLTVTIKSSSSAGGSFRLTTSSAATQSGTYQVLSGTAPGTPAGKVYDLIASSGSAPFSTTGHFRMLFANDGTYQLRNVGTGTSTTGSYTNRASNASSLVFGFGDSSLGSGQGLFAYSNATAGIYGLDNGSGFQSGKFHELLLPTITQSPTNVSVPIGKSAKLTVRTTGEGPLSYQWYFEGNLIAGATNSSLALTNVNGSNGGSYFVSVSNDAGSTNSSAATVTIVFPPTITAQPLGSTNATGSTVMFSVGTTGTAPLGYQWQFNGVNMAGKTTSSLTLTNLKTSNSGGYRVIVKNAAGTVTSATARLQVLTRVTITSAPRGYLANTNMNALLSVTAKGATPLRYQWQFEGVNIEGATNAQYIVNKVSTTNIGTYTVVVSNSVSTANASAVVAVTSSPFDPNHDGQTDLLLRANDGRLITWFLSGTSFLKNIALNNGQPVDPTWRVAGLSDFNHDGEKDLLLQNTNTGALSVWFMDGTNFIGTTMLSNGVVGAEWKVGSVADFDLDGSGDLVAQNTTNDLVAVWRMDGTNFLNVSPIILFGLDERNGMEGWYPLATERWFGTKLQLIGVGNFHLKGFSPGPDILTQSADGHLVTWRIERPFTPFEADTNLLASTNCFGYSVVYVQNSNGQFAITPGASWKAVTTADLTADGESDVIFQSGGYLEIWYLNGPQFLSGVKLRANQPIDSRWRVVGPK